MTVGNFTGLAAVQTGQIPRDGGTMDLHNMLVMTPTGHPDPSTVIAACRAGARGILDLEIAPSLSEAKAALQKVAAHRQSPFGVKLATADSEWLALLDEFIPKGLAFLVLAGGDPTQATPIVEHFRDPSLHLLWEATSIEEVEHGRQLGISGLILKGQEAGGRVGDETTFVLLQRWRKEFGPESSHHLPAWVQGGIGLNTAAAVMAAGASGIVLESQLLLTKESSLRKSARQWLSAFDGSQTVCLGERLGATYRLRKFPGCPIVEALTQEEAKLEAAELSPAEKRTRWQNIVAQQSQTAEKNQVVFLGQAACFAQSLADRYVTVAGVLQGIAERIEHNLASARNHLPLSPDSHFARQHGIKYPILQGPMTRVSDTAAFADSVSKAGALPFLALAVLRKKATETLLGETQKLLGDRSWGVGLLGFLPPEIRKEQTGAIRKFKPPFALIAGGRPDQAKELEDEGIPTYLHVPSPGLLKMFLKDGALRFIFEGRECGGHVGPRGSFILWETMCELLLEYIHSGGKADQLHIVFAGGIHDAASTAAVSALAAPLAEKGVAVGVLMGTAYLFTKEAVEG
ncbi:MAG: nitronate monooxygenase, partial [Planctomycetaceae bacterium]|nr:nitronate monooxygenase [Planctomycetaceae bacterium]